MKKTRTPQAVIFSGDDPIVILGDHLALKEAVLLANHDLGEDFVNCYGQCVDVKHMWARYEFMSELDEDYDEPGHSWWVLYDQEKRPKGVVIKATVLEFK